MRVLAQEAKHTTVSIDYNTMELTLLIENEKKTAKLEIGPKDFAIAKFGDKVLTTEVPNLLLSVKPVQKKPAMKKPATAKLEDSDEGEEEEESEEEEEGEEEEKVVDPTEDEAEEEKKEPEALAAEPEADLAEEGAVEEPAGEEEKPDEKKALKQACIAHARPVPHQLRQCLICARRSCTISLP